MALKVMAYKIRANFVHPLCSKTVLFDYNNIIGFESYANKAAMATGVKKIIKSDVVWSNAGKDIKCITEPVISYEDRHISFTVDFKEHTGYGKIAAFIVYDDSNDKFKPFFVHVLENGICYGAESGLKSITMLLKWS